jgi:lipopolysaccharide transport system permease protein
MREREGKRAKRRASAKELRAQLDVLLTLALAELRERYGRGPGQLVKWFADPYAATGVYLIFIAFVVDRSGDAPGLVVACAVIPFQVFLTTIFAALTVTERDALILNLDFRRDLLPAAVTLTETIGFATSLTLLPLMMVAYGIGVTTAIAWLPAALGVNLLLALGASYPAALFGMWYREMVPFALSVVRIMLFLAPGVVALAEVTGRAHDLLKLNPLTGVFEAYRDALLYGQPPALWELAVPAGFALAMLAISVPIFRSEQAHLAKIA